MPRQHSCEEAANHDEGPDSPGNECLFLLLVFCLRGDFVLQVAIETSALTRTSERAHSWPLAGRGDTHFLFACSELPIHTFRWTSWLFYPFTLGYAGSPASVIVAAPMLELYIPPWLGHGESGVKHATAIWSQVRFPHPAAEFDYSSGNSTMRVRTVVVSSQPWRMLSQVLASNFEGGWAGEDCEQFSARP